MNPMTTMSEVLNNLYAEGYTTDLNLKDNCLVCRQNMLELHPEDFIVDRYYRFEGALRIRGMKGLFMPFRRRNMASRVYW